MEFQIREPSSEHALRARIRFLIGNSSQAEVARRTGTPQSSLSRYLKDRSVPVRFCAQLALCMGVNPTWLLVGEGTPYLSDITAETSATASDLTELVAAMNAVTQLQLGSLTGHDNTQILKQLSARLDVSENLQARLHERTQPFFSTLLRDLDNKIEQQKFDEAESLLPATAQAARLCTDDALHARLDELTAKLHWAQGRRTESLAVQRRVFSRAFASNQPLTRENLEKQCGFLIALFDNEQLPEALRWSRALRGLYDEELDPRETALLRAANGLLQVEMGSLVNGLATLQRAIADMESPQKEQTHSVLVFAQLLRGVLALPSAIRAELARVSTGPSELRDTTGGVLLRVALCLEDRVAIETILNAIERDLGGPGAPERRILARHGRAALDAMQGSPKSYNRHRADEELIAKSESEHAVVRFHTRVLWTQVARYGHEKEAEKLALEAESIRRSLGKSGLANTVVPWFTTRWLHFRNLKELGLHSKTVNRWWQDHTDRGYRLDG